jgi:SNF2 family DNA or RNA helicase
MEQKKTKQVTRAVALVNAQYRLGLSGTPIMNSGKEMITLLKYNLLSCC